VSAAEAAGKEDIVKTVLRARAIEAQRVLCEVVLIGFFICSFQNRPPTVGAKDCGEY
jgi:hypothetical protein